MMAEADRRPPNHIGTPLNVSFHSIIPLLTEATALEMPCKFAQPKA